MAIVFLAMRPKIQALKENIDKMGFIKVKKKNNVFQRAPSKSEKTTHRMGEILSNYILIRTCI